MAMTPDQLSPPETTPVRRWLLTLVDAVCRHPRLVLAVSLLLCGFSIFAACTRLQYHTSRSDLISPRKGYQQRWQRYLAEFGDDDDIVVVLKGNDPARLTTAIEAIADRIRQKSDLFDRLFYKADLRKLRNRALLFLPLGEIQSIRQNIGGMGPLLMLGPLGWSNLSLGHLLADAQTRAAHFKPDQPLSDADKQFLGQLVSVCRSVRAGLADPDRYRNPWGSLMARSSEQKDQLAEPQYFLTEDNGDGCLAFLLVRPIKEAGSFTAALRSVEAMRAIVAEVRSVSSGIEFGLTGMPVLETDEMAAAQHDTQTASWLAIAGVSLLFLLVYRSLWYPMLTVVSLLVGTTWALGWLTLTVGHLNILSATFAVMLIGMGDYGVLWVMRYEQARRRGMQVREALLHTTTHVAVGNLTAAWTLALAFFAAMFADFQAVAELGWIAGCGVLLCAFACFTVLPASLMLFDRRLRIAECGLRIAKPFSHEEDVESVSLPIHNPQSTIRNRDDWLPWLSRRAGWVVVGSVVVVLVAAFWAMRVTYDHNLLHLQAHGLESVRWELMLIERTGGAGLHGLSITDSPAEAMALKAQYEKLPEVGRVASAAELMPPDQPSKLPLVRAIADSLTWLPERGRVIPHVRPDPKAIRRQVEQLQDRLTPFGDAGLPGELRVALRGLQTELAQLTDSIETGERLRDLDQRLAGDLAENLHRLRDVATAAPITVDDLPADLRERHVSPHGKWLLRIFPKDSLWDFQPLAHFCQRIRTIDANATGKPFGTVEGLKAMKDGLTRAGVYAFLVIVAVLYLDFRHVGHTLIALTPLLLGVLLSLGVMGVCGFPLNPANMIAFPLILGVGVDNGVHVLHDYLLRRGAGRPSVSHAIGRGVLVKAMTTMIGFGTLMIATERGLSGLGFILTLGVGCSMLSSLILLPAVFSLADRRLPVTAVSRASEMVRRAA
jgi:hopanoid biosynthesis associated RND transporter like protein HpnN